MHRNAVAKVAQSFDQAPQGLREYIMASTRSLSRYGIWTRRSALDSEIEQTMPLLRLTQNLSCARALIVRSNLTQKLLLVIGAEGNSQKSGIMLTRRIGCSGATNLSNTCC